MTPNNYKDQFTEYLEIKRDSLILLGEKMAYTAVQHCLEKYRQLAPTWIPVTPETMPDLPRDTNLGHLSIHVLVNNEKGWFPAFYNYDTNEWMNTFRFEKVTPSHYQIIVPPTK